MKDIEFTALSDEELLAQQKKNKTNDIINAVLCGFLIGIAVYSAVKNGFGFATLLPLVLLYIAYINKRKGKALANELKSRNLK